ncbi:MAG: hypothetical protein COV70_00115 [Parcubacteria group bacterium CG11_big_fil_rev_8_21_14_0_20_39_22]|nr:MAG: hypothetical protein COV70_00115 [Parcubacteria group bacterium CG11_big_fil_rev_8_21_14_0_20_39_22]
MDTDIKWFFGLLGVFFLLWIAGGGVNSDTARKPFIKPFPEGGKNETYGEDLFPGNAPAYNSSGKTNTSSGSGTNAGTNTNSPYEGNTGSNTLVGKISIQRVTLSYNDDPSSEYISLSASHKNNQPILITGLTLKSTKSGKSVTVGQGSKVVFPGRSYTPENIYLNPGETAHVVTGNSPLGQSFKPNKCIGYLTQKTRVVPSFYISCPHPSDEPLPEPPNQLSDECLDYIDRIPRCSTPGSPPQYLPGQCQRYITENINYNTCFELHKNDTDFYRDNWYVYLKRSQIQWKDRRENIKLVDQNGNVLDSYSY